MKTRTIGEILREEREFHHLSLESLSKRTRIRQEYLEALEQNQFELLPAATFVKGYIKTYGQIFGFDYQPLLGLLRRDFKESAKGKLVPREFIKPVLSKKPWLGSITGTVIVVATVFLALFGYVGFQWFSFNRPPDIVIEAPEENAEVASQVVVTGRTKVDSIVTVNDQPVALQSDGSFETQIFLPTEGVNSITIEAKDRRGKSKLVQRTVVVKF